MDDYKKIVRRISGNKRFSIKEQINLIKTNINVGDYSDAIKMHPLYIKYLNKSPFFQSIDEIYIKEPFQFTKDLKREFKWITCILENYLTQINLFLFNKNQFDKFVLLEDYENARVVLNKIEEDFGISLWSIEANLILEEKINGSESNWNLLSFYLKEIKNPIYEFNINSSSKRIEEKLSYESFLNQFQNDIDSIKADGLIEDFLVFKNFNIVNYEFRYKNLESVIFVSNILSIIDQYLILIEVIIYNISKDDNNDKIFSSFINKCQEVITNDFRIQNLYNVINEKNDFKLSANNNDILSCLNHYYEGNFSSSLSESETYIQNNPLEYEVYEVYCKSLINLNLEFKPIKSSESVNEILFETYKLFTFNSVNEDSWKKLLKISLKMMNINFGKQVYALLNEVEGLNPNRYITGFISSSFNSHKNVFLFNKKKNSKNNFKGLENQHCFKVQNYIRGYELSDNNEIITTSVSQLLIFNALHFFESDDFIKTVEILNSIDLTDNNYYQERKISLLYYSYIELNLIEECLLLFGEVFFNKSLIAKKLDYFRLYKKASSENNKTFLHLIEYPILCSLLNKEYDVYEAYDDFLCNNDIYEINDLLNGNLLKNYSLDMYVYFLHKVATIDTIKYSSEYNSINEVEEDRLLILKKLIEIDIKEKLVYEREIDEILRVNSVRKAIKEVDEGRLYIDVGSLKEIQVKKLKDDFVRFKEIETSSNFQNLIGFNTSSTKNWEKAITSMSEVNDKYNSADYLAFKSIYLESRDNFLYSKEYGLDSCLSTRIRHGALKNHIRSVFEKLNLITSKINNDYKDNEVWKLQLSGLNNSNFEVQSILKNFSRSIDDTTIFIVENLLQITTERNTDKQYGLFQYYTYDELLYNFYSEHKFFLDSVESTIDIILTNIVNYTLINLQKTIVDYFTINLTNDFQSIIDNTVAELRKLNLPNECELIINLTKSSTEIQKELEYLSEWFYLNTTSSSSLLSIETIINASLDLTNKINPLYNLKPIINIENDFAGYSNLIFVFNILFKNVIEHSKLENDKIKIKIESVIEDEKYVLIKFTNNLNPKHDYSSNINKLETIKLNWNNHENIERSNKEGESGYDKIKRILIYEALAKTDKFEYKISKNSISITLYFPYNKAIE